MPSASAQSVLRRQARVTTIRFSQPTISASSSLSAPDRGTVLGGTSAGRRLGSLLRGCCLGLMSAWIGRSAMAGWMSRGFGWSGRKEVQRNCAGGLRRGRGRGGLGTCWKGWRRGRGKSRSKLGATEVRENENMIKERENMYVQEIFLFLKVMMKA